ncbi:hypothetical protein GALMADRAFT_141429 [Galerina marginata CBS 339.88]|uniref:Peptidase C14 caspase domain-containing protein n=1 Tax=Galerina marginata (strain CBS 339.88) TaxID=685588 RepID=A0A067STY0_GALM3|nr:hypothetical protein GALMADRAFT_141429 [Galerina marginata CBS 339.88]
MFQTPALLKLTSTAHYGKTRSVPLVFSSRLFALLIGVNNYASSDIRPLHGAVADAQSFQTYLLQLGVPEDNITILLDESATRSAILGELRHLADDPSIQPEDPILIFYAGYGSEMASPSSWKAAGLDDMVQFFIPHDVCWKPGETAVAPIPDRTLNALLDAIADKKGDNIVVVMDSCPSYPQTRIYRGSSELIRSVCLPADFQLEESQDQDIWSRIPTNRSLRSHVLLTACGPGSYGQAYESNGRGDFTVALLHFLEESKIDDLRYRDIVMRMHIDLKQNPQCQGCNRDRYIFTTTSAPPPIEHYATGCTHTNGTFAHFVNGGAVHGLAAGDEFDVYAHIICPEPAGTLVVEKVGSFYSTARVIPRPITDGSPGVLILPGTTVAIRVKWEPLCVYIEPQAMAVEMLPLLSCTAQPVSGFVFVDDPECSSIVISIQQNRTFFRLRPICSTHLFDIIEPTAEELARLLKAARLFMAEVGRCSDFQDVTIRHNIKVEVYELDASPSPAGLLSAKAISYKNELRDWYDVIGPVMLREGSCYALKLINNCAYDLYPTVAYFDSSNGFHIDTLYQPPTTRSHLDPPLRKGGGTLTIGYGPNGSPLVIPPLPTRPPRPPPPRPGSGPGSNRDWDWDGEAKRCLKITLCSRPQDPNYDDRSFRVAGCLPGDSDVKGPWAEMKLDILPCE